jgi:hypothetical protein
MFSTYISKQVATYLNTKRGNKEEEESLKKETTFSAELHEYELWIKGRHLSGI